MAQTPTLISSVRNFAAKIQNADSTGKKDLGLAPPAAGTRLKSLVITTDETTQRTLQLVKTVGGVDYILGEIDVPIGAGTDGATNAIDVFAGARLKGLQTDGVSKWIDLGNGATLSLQAKVAITAGKTIYITGEGGDFT